VDYTIVFSRPTVKELTHRLQLAWRSDAIWLLKRLSALVLLADQRPVPEIAARLSVSTETIYAWRAAFLVRRWDSLTRRTSRGRPPKLTTTQRMCLKDLVVAGPQAAGYDTGCWNSALIQDLIQREFGRSYNVHYISELLRNLGFSYQKARFVSDHLDEQRRTHWREVEWPAIVRSAQRRRALLLFADEASFAQWGSLGYTWALRGQQPLVRTTGKRKGYKVMGMLDYFSGRLFFQGSTERFTAKRYRDFLATILTATKQSIIVIQDGARYHTAAETKTFIAQHARRLTVHQLPSYSPDYNPIEHLWRNVKRDKTHNRYFPSFEALLQAVDAGLTKFENDPAAVKQLMGPYLEQAADLALAA